MSDSTAKSAIVIGVGAARGVGAAVARRFALGGFHVVIAGRTEERRDERATEIRALGGKVTIHPTDVLATMYRHLGIDLNGETINNAGRPIPLLPSGRPIAELI